MKYELINRANNNILLSWLQFSSNPPNPSQSMTIHLVDWPCNSTGYEYIHNPLVHGLIVLPTPNAYLSYNRILFSRNDFPVLYLPTTQITANGSSIDFSNDSLSLLISNPRSGKYLMKGIAYIYTYY